MSAAVGTAYPETNALKRGLVCLCMRVQIAGERYSYTNFAFISIV